MLLLLLLVLVQLYRGVVRVQTVISALLVVVSAVVLVRHHDILRLRTIRRLNQWFQLRALQVVQPDELGQVRGLVDGGRLPGLDGFAVDQVPVQVGVEKFRRHFTFVGQLDSQVVRDDDVVCLTIIITIHHLKPIHTKGQYPCSLNS